MKKLIVFIFSIVLLGSCDKEEWHEHRVVNFGFNEDISYNQNDGELTRFDFRIEYKIIGDPNADTSSVNLLDVTYEESQWSSQNHSKWVNFDNLSYYVAAIALKFLTIGTLDESLPVSTIFNEKTLNPRQPGPDPGLITHSTLSKPEPSEIGSVGPA